MDGLINAIGIMITLSLSLNSGTDLKNFVMRVIPDASFASIHKNTHTCIESTRKYRGLGVYHYEDGIIKALHYSIAGRNYYVVSLLRLRVNSGRTDEDRLINMPSHYTF